jgi:hypothetical protein
LGTLTTFMELIYLTKIRRDVEDQICWRPIKSGLFEVECSIECFILVMCALFPWKSMWKAKVLLKVVFFTWTIALGKIVH